MVVPPAVRDGDLVAVIAPAGRLDPTRFRAGLDRLAGRLRLRVADDIERRAGYFAGSDARRAEELDAALRDPDVRAVLLGRGGYGITRILPLLDPAPLRADPKPIVAFSDGTALLSWAARVAGVRGIHGPVIGQLGDLDDGDLDGLVRALRDPAPPGRLGWSLSPCGAALPGPVAGCLVGGNLTLMSSLVGTPWQVDARGGIVFFEEVAERPYAIDRMLTHLAQAGALAGAHGALVGDLTRCGPSETDHDDAAALAVFDERLGHVGIPGLRGAPIGHGTRNACLPWGARAVLHPGGGLEVLDGAVA